MINILDYIEKTKAFSECKLPEKTKEDLMRKAIFIDKPHFSIDQLSHFQHEILHRTTTNTVCNVFISRQHGKSTLGGTDIIYNAFLLPAGSKLALVGVDLGTIAKVLYDQCIIPFFLGRTLPRGINGSMYSGYGTIANYIYLNALTFEALHFAFQDFSAQAVKYSQDMIAKYPDMDMTDINNIYPPNIVELLHSGVLIIHNNTPYVKFFVDNVNFSSPKDGIILGTLFNGTQISHFGGTTAASKVRGGNFQLIYFEEIGETDISITQDIVPAMNSGRGKMLSVFFFIHFMIYLFILNNFYPTVETLF